MITPEERIRRRFYKAGQMIRCLQERGELNASELAVLCGFGKRAVHGILSQLDNVRYFPQPMEWTYNYPNRNQPHTIRRNVWCYELVEI